MNFDWDQKPETVGDLMRKAKKMMDRNAHERVVNFFRTATVTVKPKGENTDHVEMHDSTGLSISFSKPSDKSVDRVTIRGAFAFLDPKDWASEFFQLAEQGERAAAGGVS